MKKLFEVQATVTAYVLAEDERDAQLKGAEAVEHETINLETHEIHVREVTDQKWPLAHGWGRGSLVYGAKNITLGSTLSSLPHSGAQGHGDKDRTTEGGSKASEGDRSIVSDVPSNPEEVQGGS